MTIYVYLFTIQLYDQKNEILTGKDVHLYENHWFYRSWTDRRLDCKSHSEVPPDFHILAYDAVRENLAAALSDNIIDGVCEEKDSRFGTCDYIFLCAPVEVNLQYLEYLKSIRSPGCIITDVGSVKGIIHEKAEALGMEDCFIGGHPMAGSEKSGFSHSTDRLIENAYYILDSRRRSAYRQAYRIHPADRFFGRHSHGAHRFGTRFYHRRRQPICLISLPPPLSIW